MPAGRAPPTTSTTHARAQFDIQRRERSSSSTSSGRTASARASATRCARRPIAGWVSAVRTRKTYEPSSSAPGVLSARPRLRARAQPEGDVRRDVQVWEQRTLLGDVTDSPSLGRDANIRPESTAPPLRRQPSPGSARSNPAITRSKVVLPLPEAPRIAVSDRSRTSSETPSSTACPAKDFSSPSTATAIGTASLIRARAAMRRVADRRIRCRGSRRHTWDCEFHGSNALSKVNLTDHPVGWRVMRLGEPRAHAGARASLQPPRPRHRSGTPPSLTCRRPRRGSPSAPPPAHAP